MQRVDEGVLCCFENALGTSEMPVDQVLGDLPLSIWFLLVCLIQPEQMYQEHPDFQQGCLERTCLRIPLFLLLLTFFFSFELIFSQKMSHDTQCQDPALRIVLTLFTRALRGVPC